MQWLRTDDARFSALPGYSWQPRYLDSLRCAPGGRLHYVEEGQGPATFLCLHGNPAWSYLYRHMIPVFARAGRVIAPDLFGFGRSDKPSRETDHSIAWHRGVLLELIERLDLHEITLVVQDWGGILGLTLPMEMPHRIRRLVVMNTTLATGEDVPEGFRQWRDYSNGQDDLAIGKLLRRGNPQLSAEEAGAYDAPFPDPGYKAAIRAFPNMLPLQPDRPGADIARRARTYLSEHWAGPSFMAVGAADPVFGLREMSALQDVIRGCPEPMVLPHAGHFVQEHGGVIAEAVLAAWH